MKTPRAIGTGVSRPPPHQPRGTPGVSLGISRPAMITCSTICMEQYDARELTPHSET